MDKNMINIDDLFKQRLGGAEENERPGAWLQMRELLDKNMPVDKVPGTSFNWRRMFGYMAALVAITAVSVGSYQAISSYRADKAGDKLATAAVYNTPATGNNNPVVINNAPKSIAATTAINKTSIHGSKTSSDISKSSVAKTTNNSPKANTNTSHKQMAGAGSAITDKNAVDNSGNSNGQIDIAAAKTDNNQAIKSYNGHSVNKLNNNSLKAYNGTKTTGYNAVNNQQNTANSTHKTVATKPNNSKQLANVGSTEKLNPNDVSVQTNDMNTTSFAANTSISGAKKPNGSEGNKINEATDINSISYAASTSTASAKNLNGANGSTVTQGNRFITRKETISRIEVRNSYKRGGGLLKVDTILMDKFDMEREVPLAASGNQQMNSNIEPMPAASTSLAKNNAVKEDMKPLSQFRTGSRKASNWTPERFEEMVKNAKFDFTQTTFHAGVIAGINSSLASNATKGFQLGLTGTLSFNEKWGIFTEIKYMQKFNSSERFDGNYYTDAHKTVDQNNNTLESWDSVQYSYKFSNLNMLEMPIAVRYSFNRFNVFSGVNMNYNFAVNAEQVSTPHHFENQPLNSNPNAYTRTSPEITIKDFSARYSVGYMLGAGYQLSPAFQLDARIAQPLWDNSNTKNSKAISKELYNMPTLQINASYRFSSNRRLR